MGCLDIVGRRLVQNIEMLEFLVELGLWTEQSHVLRLRASTENDIFIAIEGAAVEHDRGRRPMLVASPTFALEPEDVRL